MWLHKEKLGCVGGVKRGYGEGLSVGLKEVLQNHSRVTGGKQGLAQAELGKGRRTADLGYSWMVDGTL